MARTLLILAAIGLGLVLLAMFARQCVNPTPVGQAPAAPPEATRGAAATSGSELGTAAAQLGAELGAGDTGDDTAAAPRFARLNPTAPEQSEPSVDADAAAGCRRDLDETLADLEVLFGNASTAIESESRAALRAFAEVATRCPETSIAIEGHTDAVGGDDQNLDLSHARARAVEAFLIEEGVDPSRLRSRGRGAAEPIADNASPEGRARNRRIEIVVE
jgi:outer membrane protein OmpA-like peptidoglycan-associated protein